MTVTEHRHRTLIDGWSRHWTAQDFTAFSALFADDMLYEDVPIKAVCRGIDEFKEQLWDPTAVAFADWTATIVSCVVDGHRGAAEFILSGLNVGTLFDHPPTGERFVVRGIAAVKFADGRIAEWRDYYDLADALATIGR
ncbi:ester cyclase [Mycolicibacterium sp.]|uniref:ester cyclase n=1 Tax=Mycolicibacterium sp. TaxID=2320850 RepID=UPI0037C77989